MLSVETEENKSSWCLLFQYGILEHVCISYFLSTCGQKPTCVVTGKLLSEVSKQTSPSPHYQTYRILHTGNSSSYFIYSYADSNSWRHWSYCLRSSKLWDLKTKKKKTKLKNQIAVFGKCQKDFSVFTSSCSPFLQIHYKRRTRTRWSYLPPAARISGTVLCLLLMYATNWKITPLCCCIL